jgi:hypothetical protein
VNPFGDFIILTTKKKIKPEGKKKKKTRPTAGETQPWVSVASGSAARWVGREGGLAARCLVAGEILPARPSRGFHPSGEIVP